MDLRGEYKGILQNSYGPTQRKNYLLPKNFKAFPSITYDKKLCNNLIKCLFLINDEEYYKNEKRH